MIKFFKQQGLNDERGSLFGSLRNTSNATSHQDWSTSVRSNDSVSSVEGTISPYPCGDVETLIKNADRFTDEFFGVLDSLESPKKEEFFVQYCIDNSYDG